MNLVILAGGGGIALLVLVALYVAKTWKPTLWALGVVLSISPLALYRIPALDNDTLFKAAGLGLVVLLWLRLGVRLRWPGGIMLGALLLALVISATHIVPSISVSSGLAVKAFAGYFLVVAALMIKWQREHLPDVLKVFASLPLLSVLIGAALQAAGLWQIDGGGRLGGALIGPTLALLSIASAFAALTGLVMLGQRRWAVWILLDFGIAFLTLTRGALIAAAILIVTLGAWAIVHRRTAAPRAIRAARWVFWGSVVVGLAALPEILARNEGNSYEGTFNTSGRDQAWPFYLSLSAHAPIVGRGLGYANIANALLHPIGVQSAFESPHNEYIHLYVDGGLLLAVPFFFGLVALALLAAKMSGQWLLVLGVLTATLVYSFSDNNFSTPQFDVPLGVLFGVLLSFGGRHKMSGPGRAAEGMQLERHQPTSTSALDPVVSGRSEAAAPAQDPAPARRRLLV